MKIAEELEVPFVSEALHQFGVAPYHEADGSADSWVVTDWCVEPDFYRRQIRIDLGFHATEDEARAVAKRASKDASAGAADSDPGRAS